MVQMRLSLLMSVTTLVLAGTVRLLPERYSFEPRPAAPAQYLTVPLTPELTETQNLLYEFSLSLWSKSHSVNTNAVLVLVKNEDSSASGSANYYLESSIVLWFPSPNKLILDLYYHELGGGVYSGGRAAVDIDPSDKNWHFIGASVSLSAATIQICRDGICASQAYHYGGNGYLEHQQVMYIGGYPRTSTVFQGRIGDLLFHPSKYLTQSDLTALAASRVVIPGCASIRSSPGFYDSCSAFALIVSPSLLDDTGYAQTFDFDTKKVTLTPGDERTFNGRTFALDSFLLSGWVAAAVATDSLAIAFSGGDTISLAATAAGVKVTVQGTAVALNCAASDGFRFFTIKVSHTSGTVESSCGTSVDSRALSPTQGSVVSLTLQGTSFHTVMWQPDTGTSALVPPLIEADLGCNALSGGKCATCKDGYYLVDGRCAKCHRYCGKCSTAGYTNCLTCSSSNYQQPLLSTVCRPFCPTGYSPSASGVCTATASISRTFNFEDRLSGDFTLPTGEIITFGFDDDYYPDYEFLDPEARKGRGVYQTHSFVWLGPHFASPSVVLGTDFTLEYWVLPYRQTVLLQVDGQRSSQSFESYLSLMVDHLTPASHSTTTSKYGLGISLSTFGSSDMKYPPVSLPMDSLGTSWQHVGVIVKYDPVTKQTQATLFTDSQSTLYTFPSFFLMPDPATMSIGTGEMYLYSMTVSGQALSLAEVWAKEGNCVECSTCPLDLGKCLPTCKQNEFVDDTGACSPCRKDCAHGCVRSNSCNLCPDPLCYRCSSYYSTVPCLQCIEGATLEAGFCRCPPGQFPSNGKCAESCDPGAFYSEEAGECRPCSAGCVNCKDGVCLKCDGKFVLQSGVCKCGLGFYVTASHTCEKCESYCKECIGEAETCSSCYTEDGYYLDSGTCRDCRDLPGYDGGLGISVDASSKDSLAIAINSVCREICGDGVIKGQLPCDDGNQSNADGCSALCTIEPGWTCDNTSGKSVCTDTSPPTARLTYLKKVDEEYALLLTFSEPIIYSGDPQDTMSVSIDVVRLFDWTAKHSDLAQAYSPISLVITPLESVPAGAEVTIEFQSLDTVKDISGNLISSRTATVTLADSMTLTVAETISSAMKGTAPATAAVAGVSAVTSMFSGSNFSMIWSFVDILQLINYIVYMSARLPDNLRAFLRALSFANFEFIPSVLEGHIHDNFNPPPQPFLIEEVSSDFLINIGNLVTICLCLVTLYILIVVLAWCLPSATVLKKMRTWFSYTVFLCCGTETFLQLALAICLQLKEAPPQSRYGGFSLATCAVVTLYLMFIGYLTISKVAMQSGSTLRQRYHRSKYGSLYRDYREEGKISRSFLLLLNARRLLFVLFLVFITDHPLLQAVLCAGLSFAYLLFLLLFRPEKRLWTGNMLQIASEVLLCIVHAIICVLASISLPIATRDGLGWAAIGLLLILILFHLGVLAYLQFTAGRELLQKANAYLSRKSSDRFSSNRELREINTIWPEELKPSQGDTHKDTELSLSARTNPYETSFGLAAAEPETAVDIRPVFQRPNRYYEESKGESEYHRRP